MIPRIMLMFGLCQFGSSQDVDGFCSKEAGCDDVDDMLLIEGGVYTMGTDLPIFVADGEAPARRVQISSFYMDKYEVSNYKFGEFVAATGHKTEAETFGDSFVMDKFVSKDTLSKVDKAVKDAPWWVSKIFFKKNNQVGFVIRISIFFWLDLN